MSSYIGASELNPIILCSNSKYVLLPVLKSFASFLPFSAFIFLFLQISQNFKINPKP